MLLERRAALGLQKGAVELAPHHPAWQRLFEDERDRLADAIDTDRSRVEHVGSTAVQGLPAKPILDIAVLVPERALMPVLESILSSRGYIDRGDKGENGGHLFVFETFVDVRTIHLHVLFDGDPQWTAYLRFRDALRADESLRDSYARLKSGLAQNLPNDRAAYMAAKNDFIRRVLATTGQ